MKSEDAETRAIEREQALRYRDHAVARRDLDLTRWPRNRFEAACRLAPGGDAVLDVGCGDGLVLYNLHGKYPRLVGVELSPLRVEHAQEMLQGLEA